MADPFFARTLTYICEHNDQGALGLVVNRPIEMSLRALFEQIDVPLEAPNLIRLPVHFGGPVQVDRGFVLHRPVGQWQSTLTVQDGIALTTSKDILQAAGRGEGPEQILVTLGYAGLGARTARARACPERLAHGRREAGRDLRTAARGATGGRDGVARRRFCQPVGYGRPRLESTVRAADPSSAMPGRLLAFGSEPHAARRSCQTRAPC